MAAHLVTWALLLIVIGITALPLISMLRSRLKKRRFKSVYEKRGLLTVDMP